MLRKLGFRDKKVGCGVFLTGLVLLSQAAAHGPLGSGTLERAATVLASQVSANVEDLRPVSYFFSADAWGGLPFSEAQKQQVMVKAMLEHALVRMELPVTHLISATDAHVRTFTAVYEVDGRGDTPAMRAGYELELLVPRRETALSVELINGDTGIANRVEIVPDGAL